MRNNESMKDRVSFEQMEPKSGRTGMLLFEKTSGEILWKRNIRMRGMMHKKGSHVQCSLTQIVGGVNWQRRFFVLHQAGSNPAHFIYFKDESIDVSNPRAIIQLTGRITVGKLLGIQYAFQVVVNGRALKVATESDLERETWMRCMRDCIARSTDRRIVHVSHLMHCH